jgi:hypothetical protein
MRTAVDTFLLFTDTDSTGHFSVPHNLVVVGMGGPHFEIDGITVAVQHNQNQNWHALEQSNAVDNRFWWNETLVEGRIGSSNFHNSPVKIIVFASYLPGAI